MLGVLFGASAIMVIVAVILYSNVDLSIFWKGKGGTNLVG
jgi:hypothetical protein